MNIDKFIDNEVISINEAVIYQIRRGVDQVKDDIVVTERGTLNKEKFYIPKDMVESYNGNMMRFKISEDDAKSRFLRDSPPSAPSSRTSKETSVGQTEETTVPLTEERLDASKRESTRLVFYCLNFPLRKQLLTISTNSFYRL
jgi:stress response protein YsnF